MNIRAIEILLIENNPGDIRLIGEVFAETKEAKNISVVKDGVEALAFLRKEGVYADVIQPSLILIDLSLPKKDGCEVLAEIKADKKLKHIPVIVFTTSNARQDIIESYHLHANCYITKPVDLDQFMNAVRNIKNFWLRVVKLPKKKGD